MELPERAPGHDAPGNAHRPKRGVATAGAGVTTWRARPLLALVTRACALVGPIAIAAGVAWSVSRLVHRPAGGLSVQLAWFFALAGASTAVLVLGGKAARRLLPLSVLLKLSLMFPDRAPSRFGIALRAGSTRRLLARAVANNGSSEATVAETILTLVAALAAHDRMTRGHCERVRAFNDLLADEVKLAPYDRDRLRWAALLHDVGKIGVPSDTLTKPGKLTDAEWDRVRRHPVYGAELAAGLNDWLGPWAASIPQHHERWDGTGYPAGLAGEDICLGGRIIAVADAFEVMTTRRPYSRPISAAAAREELARCAGTQFDPRVVRAFMNISLGKLHRAIGPLAWLAELPLVGAAPQLGNVAALAGRAAAGVGVGAVIAAGTPTMAPVIPRAMPAPHGPMAVRRAVLPPAVAAPSTARTAPPARSAPAGRVAVTAPAGPRSTVAAWAAAVSRTSSAAVPLPAPVISVTVAPPQAPLAHTPVQTVEEQVAGAVSTVAKTAPLGPAGEVARGVLGSFDGTIGGNPPA
jgi:hypothetical protein